MFSTDQRVKSLLVENEYGTVIRQYPEGAVDVRWDDGTSCMVSPREIEAI